MIALPPPPDLATIRDAVHADLQLKRALWSSPWEKVGKFEGDPMTAWLGPRAYRFLGGSLRFIRQCGQTIAPGDMTTDGGSVPRVAWMIPNLDPWTYFPAYLVHDWLFQTHHLGANPSTFEEANLTLAEGIWTLQQTGVAPGGWIDVEAIYRAVASPFGRAVWDRGTSGLVDE